MLYSVGNVSVDKSFARFGPKSYAINKINSTEVRTRTTPGSWGYFIWAPITALFLLIFLFSFLAPSEAEGSSSGPEIVGIITAFFGMLTFRSFGRRKKKMRYQLYLTTSSSEIQAFETEDEAEIRQLLTAIETAMASDGRSRDVTSA